MRGNEYRVGMPLPWDKDKLEASGQSPAAFLHNKARLVLLVNILQRKKLRKWNVKKLAREMGINDGNLRAIVRRLEQEDGTIQLDTLAALAAAFKVKLSTMLEPYKPRYGSRNRRKKTGRR